jgi:hypothetical protein
MVDNVATDESCGGFNADNSLVELTNALIAGNAGNAGCAYMGTLNLVNATVAGNTHSSGSGGIAVGGSGTAAVRNSILYLNGNADLECDPEATCTVEYSDLEHAWPGGEGNISQDPLFGDFYRLTYPSPALDSGTSDGAPDHDLDGAARPFEPASGLWDMGAYEFWPTPNLVAVAVSPQQQSGVPGDEVAYEFSVTNSGDYPDTYHMTLSGYTWPTTLSTPSTDRLEPGATEVFQVTVEVPVFGLAYVWGTDGFSLTVASSWEPYPVAVLPGTTTAEANLAVALTPVTQEGEGRRGKVVEYLLTVTNNGEYTDDYSLTLVSGWTAQLSTLSILDLAAGQSVQVTLSVTVPAGASTGDSDEATVTVCSATDPAVTDQATATTTAAGVRIYLPIVFRGAP